MRTIGLVRFTLVPLGAFSKVPHGATATEIAVAIASHFRRRRRRRRRASKLAVRSAFIATIAQPPNRSICDRAQRLRTGNYQRNEEEINASRHVSSRKFTDKKERESYRTTSCETKREIRRYIVDAHRSANRVFDRFGAERGNRGKEGGE